MFKKIMLCSDGSETALKAARVAAEIAQKFDAKLISLSVYDPTVLTSSYVGIPGGSLAAATDASRYADETFDAIEKATGRILEEAKIGFETRRELGHPVERIAATAHDAQADLIVMGCRGLGGFQRFVLGSVSDGVLHHAHCAVLIVR